MTPDDDLIRDVLGHVRTIALVGFSANPGRPSHGVARFLQTRGYRVIPVNPGLAGETWLGEKAHGSLAEISEPVDMIDIFRRSEEVAGVTKQSLELDPLPYAIWTQLGVHDEQAAQQARAQGVRVIQGRCPAIEISRLRIGER